ncbi:TetR/AcrR family transcriptional regulator [Leifsonia sp. AG29]|uniref:TetR/AcrR family transcriptional regulator n=1 Tax=Leifsonia sp. AG29 TaxID=2598860 RepID=UPI00131E6610|nr:TetR/AcrR family transcriptional regulator [Leifsonia sp. AG29]
MHTSSQPSSALPGLRERKKAQTRSELERAAVSLALERDFDTVTVDEICACVPVSHRTFFNYFDSKEDALFGIRRAWGDPDLVAQQLAAEYDGSVLAAVVETLFRSLPAEHSEPGLQASRLLIASRHPGLVDVRTRRLESLRAGLVSAVAGLIARERPEIAALDSSIDGEAMAELLVVTAIAAVRVAVREWAADGARGDIADVSARATRVAGALAPLLQPLA